MPNVSPGGYLLRAAFALAYLLYFLRWGISVLAALAIGGMLLAI